MATKKEQKEFNDSVAALKADISGKTFHGAYLIYGEEGYLISRYKKQLIGEILPEGDTMNLNVFRDSFLEDEIIDLIATVPFFADKRVVILEDTGVLQASNKRLAEAVKSMPDTTVLIITERVTYNANGTPKSVMDKRTAIYKTLKEKALIINCIIQSRSTLEKWVLSLVKSEDKLIDAKSLSLFLDLVGTDMMRIENEATKLFSYCANKGDITSDDVLSIVSGIPTDRMFDFIDAVSEGSLKEAMRLYADLSALRAGAGRIDAMLIRHFNIVLRAKDLYDKGQSDKQIAQALGVSPFFVGQYIRQSRRFNRKSLVVALNAIAMSVSSQRAGIMNEDIALEMLITDLCKASAIS